MGMCAWEAMDTERLPMRKVADVLMLRHKDPAAQLRKLAQQQSEALLRRLSGDDKESVGANRDIPSRPLPFGSEPVVQPSYPAQSTQGVVSPKPVRVGSASIPEPSYTGPGAAWEKGEIPSLRQTPKSHTNG